jgi:sugar/nucleoside kinase (ribokinase family)
MAPEVCVIGEINPDLILYGVPEPLEPEHETLIDGFRLTLGSSSAIFAHNLSALGTTAGMVSKTGADHFGKICREWLESAGVDLSQVSIDTSGTPTGITVIQAKPGQRYILTYPGTMFEIRRADLNLDYIFSARHLHVASYFLQKSLRPHFVDLFRQAKARGLSTSLDTNDDPADKWDGLQEVLPFVDILFPNEREAKKLAATDDLDRAIAKLAQVCRIVAVKRGAHGAIARSGANEWRHDGVSVKSIDAVGAGDSFDAGYVHRYLQGAAPPECLAYASVAGAFSTTCEGGTEAFKDRRRLEEFFRAHVASR